MNLYLGSWYDAWPDGQLSVGPTNAETLAPFDNEALRKSCFGRRSSRNSQHSLSASAAEVEQACVVEEQPTRTSASRRRIKRLQKRVEKSVAPVSSYLWQSDVRHVIVSGMRDGRVSQRAVIRVVSSRPGSPDSDGRWRLPISRRSTRSKGGRLCHAMKQDEEKSLGDKTTSKIVGRCNGKRQLPGEGATEQDLQSACLIRLCDAEAGPW